MNIMFLLHVAHPHAHTHANSDNQKVYFYKPAHEYSQLLRKHMWTPEKHTYRQRDWLREF